MKKLVVFVICICFMGGVSLFSKGYDNMLPSEQTEAEIEKNSALPSDEIIGNPSTTKSGGPPGSGTGGGGPVGIPLCSPSALLLSLSGFAYILIKEKYRSDRM